MTQPTLFPLVFQRQLAQPVDVDQVFANTFVRNSYLSHARRYPGQIVSDLEANAAFILDSTGTTWIPIGIPTVTPTPQQVYAPQVVQSIMGGTTNSSQLVGTFPNPLTPGNYIIALWSSYTNSYNANGNGFTSILTQGEAADNLIVNYKKIQSGDSQTQQCGTVAASSGIFAMFEVSGFSTPPSIDVSKLVQINSTTNHTESTTATTSYDLALVLSYSTSTGTGLIPDPTWTVDQTIVNASGRDGWAGHKVYPTIGSTISETTTFTSSVTNEVILIGIKSAPTPQGTLFGTGSPTLPGTQGLLYFDTSTTTFTSYVYYNGSWNRFN